ncbi:Uncharacterised protein [Yersinia enterocolitica]|nr:Uncharacterised protein [Yersinia enterocolitica]
MTDEQLAAVLQFEQCERNSFTLTIRDQYTVLALADIAWTHIIIVTECGVQQACT